MTDIAMGGFNTTASLANYPQGMVLANTVSGGALLFLIIMIFGIGLLIVLITSLQRFTTFFRMFDKLINSIRYTLFGAGIMVAVYGIYVACTLLAEFGSGINPIHLGLGITAYAVITVIGYGASRIITKFGKMYAQYKLQNPKAPEEITPVTP